MRHLNIIQLYRINVHAFFDDAEVRHSRVYANVDKMFKFGRFIIKNQILKFGPTLNYPPKSAARRLL